MPVVTRSQKKLLVSPSTHLDSKESNNQFTKKELARIQSIANRIIIMPKDLPDKYKNMSNADVLKHAIINNKNGTATPAEQKLTRLYDETCNKVIKATYIEKLESLVPVPSIQMEVKELNPVIPVVSFTPDNNFEPVVLYEPVVLDEPVNNVPRYSCKPISCNIDCDEIRPGIYRKMLSNGTIYEGEMKNGMFHGYGKYTYPITESDEVRNPTYTGHFANNLEHGKGRYDWGLAYDYYYEGDFVNGYFHGRGIFVCRNITQVGNYVCGKLNMN